MSDFKNYDNFFVPTDNLDAAKQFYGEILGLSTKFDFSDAGMIAFKVGDQEPAIIVQDVAKIPNAKSAIWFTVDNVRSTYKALQSKGIVFLSEPYEIPTGLAAQFTDPFGNRLGITDYSTEAHEE
jgi:predicted enzyme related to lactoylglutathione lyase